jgi:hypothetical protein
LNWECNAIRKWIKNKSWSPSNPNIY